MAVSALKIKCMQNLHFMCELSSHGDLADSVSSPPGDRAWATYLDADSLDQGRIFGELDLSDGFRPADILRLSAVQRSFRESFGGVRVGALKEEIANLKGVQRATSEFCLGRKL
jgi:hypothetical protein